MQLTVGISDARISTDPQDELVAYALGSCIGVSLFDARTRVAGMLHFQLPDSAADKQRAVEKPLMYADTGMMALLARMEQCGANRRRMRVRLAGAAQMLNDVTFFDIGRRNHAAIRKIFWKLGMFIDAEHIGGDKSRTMVMKVADGVVTIKCDRDTIFL